MCTILRCVTLLTDGMGGGDQVYRNLIFNADRETGDHGEFAP